MNSYKILGVNVSDTTFNKIIDAIGEAIKNNHKIQICTTNNEFIIEARKNHHFKSIINGCDISTADSTGVVWAIKRIYGKNIQKIPGVDLFDKICATAKLRQFRIFLLGGEKSIALKAKKILQRRYIGLHIVGSIDGIKIDPRATDQKLIATINKAKPDIVAVALGAPKQEEWIFKNKKLIRANVFIGLGGTFDYISGKIHRAPKGWQNAGLEWLYRLFHQPARIVRILKAVVLFPVIVVLKAKTEVDNN